MWLLLNEVGWLTSQCHTRGRVVVVVGGVMSILGDGKAVRKAKDHSRDASVEERFAAEAVSFPKLGTSSHAMESRMR